MNEFPMTPRGKKLIEDELEKLIKVDREEIKIALAEARALGDLKENAEYHAAKEKQSHNEGKIADLQNKVAKAKVVDPTKLNTDKIMFGATVTIFDVDKEESTTFQIVGDDEAQATDNMRSFNSPICKALIGKEEGDEVTVKVPKGEVNLEIESVEYK
jgi:transcription elongation factor GreA